jgi:hypothetical protein
MTRNLLAMIFLLCSTQAISLEKLPSEYLIKYGDSEASTEVIEYFSLSCKDCLRCFVEDFKSIQKEFIDTKKVSWAFHPNPADLLTLQAMVCLERLEEKEKILFLETVIEILYEQELSGIKEDNPDPLLVMKLTMQALGKPILNLDELDQIKATKAYSSARFYLKQPDFVRDIPTVEINGKIYDEFPNKKFLKNRLEKHLQPRNPV